MARLAMLEESLLNIGSCTGEENIGAEVVNDHTCEGSKNIEHYRTTTKGFICFLSKNQTLLKIQVIKYIIDMCIGTKIIL